MGYKWSENSETEVRLEMETNEIKVVTYKPFRSTEGAALV